MTSHEIPDANSPNGVLLVRSQGSLLVQDEDSHADLDSIVPVPGQNEENLESKKKSGHQAERPLDPEQGDMMLQALDDHLFVSPNLTDVCLVAVKRLRILLAVAVLLITVGLATWRGVHFRAEEKVEQRSQLYREAFDVASRLRNQLKTSASSVYTMASIAEVDGGVFLDANFQTIASTVLSEYRGISNFDIAPFGVVKYKVPLEGNEGAIGHAMFSDYRRIEATLETVQQRKLLIDGPLKLLQGGSAVIARYPVFTRFSPVNIPDIYSWWPTWNHSCCTTSLPLPSFGAETLPGPRTADGQPTYFWGLIEFVTKLDKLVEDLNLEDAGSIMHYQFRNVHPHPSMSDPVFLQSENAPVDFDLKDPVVIPISLPEIGIQWEFAALPIDGWTVASPLFILTMVSLCIGLCVSLVSIFLMELQQQQIESARQLLKTRVRMVQSFYSGRSDTPVLRHKW